MKKVLLILSALCAIYYVNAQPGTPDKTYGNKGRVQTNLGVQDKATGMAVQKDGKNIVVGFVGVITNLAGYTVEASNFAVARYNVNGSLDSSFGDGGKVLTKFSYNATDVAVDVVLQPDGKIVVGGYGEKFGVNSISPAAAEVIRYNTNGSIDSTFGTNGKARYEANSPIFIASIALQSDGKIVLGGIKDDRFAAFRFTKSGRFDSSFGNKGIGMADFGSYCSVSSIAADANDNIVMTGASQVGKFLSARLDKNGMLDKKFGGNGFVLTSFASKRIPKSADATSVLVQPDGKIVVGGNVSFGIDINLIFHQFGIARYNTDGSLDKSFGDDGKRLIIASKFGELCLAYKILLKPDGKILQIGESGINIAIAQILPNGQLDKSYGNDGVRNHFSFDGTYISPALTAVLQKDGKLITGGYVTAEPLDSLGLDWSIVRFNGDDDAAEKVNSNTIITKAAEQKSLSVSSLSVYPNPVQNNTATLSYTLAKAEKVTISIADMQGNILKVFLREINQAAGKHNERLTLPAGMISGTYTIAVRTPAEKKMVTIIK